MSPDARPLLALAAPPVKEPMSHAPDLTMPHAGDILGGRYVLAERIGAGGMGRVFRARDEVLRRDVAVKIFFTDRTDEAESLRRMAEARALAALDHPALVTLYDARLDTDDHVYLVMELINGPSLQRRIEQGVLAPAEVAGIMADLAAALAVVHEAGIVHRDVKPSNVLLRPLRGSDRAVEAVLADFGVAHLMDATRLTTPGTVIGTAAYLAPEQVRGEAPQPAADVYALGLLAIEALTRLHPFGGGSVQETLLARLARQPDVPSTLGYEWRSLLSAMTAHDPSARPRASAVAERAAALAVGQQAIAADTGPLTVATGTTWADLGLPDPTPDDDSPTARVTAPVPAVAASRPAGPVAAPAFLDAASSTARSAALDEDHPSPVASDPAERETVPASVRSRRRRWAWAGVGTAAAVVVGGHLVAFSFAGAGGVPATGGVPSPAPSLVAETPESTPSAPVSDTLVDPVVNTDQRTTETSPADQTPVEVVPLEPAPADPPVSDPGTDPGPGSGAEPGRDAGGGPGSGRGNANGADNRNGNGNGNANGSGNGNGAGVGNANGGPGKR
ncbi:protein kinase [Microbacterium sp. NPDC089188]|uniref:serine/threonine-protein kinase n=1 Tax=Microbacterium sp. NPDC089188 TaxID=3154971 RepID=UPI00342FFC30